MTQPHVRRPNELDRLLAVSTGDGAPSARNLLVTVFGDAVVPNGIDVAVSVRSLSNLLEGFGISERLVRTSLTRLVNDGLLMSISEGRRSFYGVAGEAHDLFRRADERIYRGTRPEWDGLWTTVMLDPTDGTAGQRAQLRQRLMWEGFGSVTPNVMASPIVQPGDVATILRSVGELRQVVVGRMELPDVDGAMRPDEFAWRCASLDDVTTRYERFMVGVQGVAANAVAALDPAAAFKFRTLLIARFRRIVVEEPDVPRRLLPEGWAGDDARSHVAGLYAACAEASERFVADTIDTARGSVTADPAGRRRRFA